MLALLFLTAENPYVGYAFTLLLVVTAIAAAVIIFVPKTRTGFYSFPFYKRLLIFLFLPIALLYYLCKWACWCPHCQLNNDL